MVQVVPDIGIYFKANVIKKMLFTQEKQIEQWNRIKSRTCISKCGKLLYDNESISIPGEIESLFNK